MNLTSNPPAPGPRQGFRAVWYGFEGRKKQIGRDRLPGFPTHDWLDSVDWLTGCQDFFSFSFFSLPCDPLALMAWMDVSYLRSIYGIIQEAGRRIST